MKINTIVSYWRKEPHQISSNLIADCLGWSFTTVKYLIEQKVDSNACGVAGSALMKISIRICCYIEMLIVRRGVYARSPGIVILIGRRWESTRFDAQSGLVCINDPSLLLVSHPAPSWSSFWLSFLTNLRFVTLPASAIWCLTARILRLQFALTRCWHEHNISS